MAKVPQFDPGSEPVWITRRNSSPRTLAALHRRRPLRPEVIVLPVWIAKPCSRDRGEQIEIVRLDGGVEEVAVAVFSVRRLGVGPCDRDAVLVTVDARHLRYDALGLAR